MMTKKCSTHHILTQPRAVAQHFVGLLLLRPSIEDFILVFPNTLSIAVPMVEMNILTRATPITGFHRLRPILVIQFHRFPSTFKEVFWQRQLQQHYSGRVLNGPLAWISLG
jgi:hypothetical protein